MKGEELLRWSPGGIRGNSRTHSRKEGLEHDIPVGSDWYSPAKILLPCQKNWSVADMVLVQRKGSWRHRL